MNRQPLRIPEQWRGQDRQFVIQLEKVLDGLFHFDNDTDERIKDLESRFNLSKIYTTPSDFPAEKQISSSSNLVTIFNAMDDYSVLFISPGQKGWGSYSTLGAKVNGVILLFKFIDARNFGINFYSTQTNSTSRTWYTFRVYQAGSTFDTILWSHDNDSQALADMWNNLSVGGYVESLSSLVSLISSKSTCDIVICGTNASTSSALFGKTDTVAAITVMFKASSSNAYYFCVNKNNATFGNISISNGTVSVLHPVSEYQWKAGSNSFQWGSMGYGYITNSQKTLFINYPVSIRPGLSVKSITITESTIRGISGYIFNDVTNFSGYTITAGIYDTGIKVRIDSTTAFNTANNTPIVGHFNGTVVLE